VCRNRPSGIGGGRGIRTPDTLSGTTVFKTAAINHSAIPPLEGRFVSLTGSRSGRRSASLAGSAALAERYDLLVANGGVHVRAHS
jgi:hypothetical protein